MVLEFLIFFSWTKNQNHRCNFPVWRAKKKPKIFVSIVKQNKKKTNKSKPNPCATTGKVLYIVECLYFCLSIHATNKQKTFLKESQQVFLISIDNQAKCSSEQQLAKETSWSSFSGTKSRRTIVYSSQDESLHRIITLRHTENRNKKNITHNESTPTNSQWRFSLREQGLNEVRGKWNEI